MHMGMSGKDITHGKERRRSSQVRDFAHYFFDESSRSHEFLPPREFLDEKDIATVPTLPGTELRSLERLTPKSVLNQQSSVSPSLEQSSFTDGPASK